jgi:hypothetical protein
MPKGVRYYSFTKYPEIAVKPEDGILALNGSFEPRVVRPSEYKEDWIRDPFALIDTLRSGTRALSRIGTGDYVKHMYQS